MFEETLAEKFTECVRPASPPPKKSKTKPLGTVDRSVIGQLRGNIQP